MRVVVLGCCHGELDKVYDEVLQMERHIGKVDLLLCSGDFQACRTEEDLKWLCVPEKYRRMGDFHRYFSGEKVAPILTIFVGGNHEAPSLLKDLYYGGWVAKNIYYLGHSGCVNVGGLRIAGASGIFNPRNYLRGHHEAPPYNADTMRSAYHVREFEIKKLAQLTGKVDILLCHDWPRGVANYGDIEDLLRKKDHTGQLRGELNSGTFGSPANAELVEKLRPQYCFAAHMHVKFVALWPHGDGTATRFLALDKCLPKRQYVQALEIQPNSSTNTLKQVPWRTNAYPSYAPEERVPTHLEVALDAEWCAILKAAYATFPLTKNPMSAKVRAPTEEELEFVQQRLKEKGASLPFNLDKPSLEVPTLQRKWVNDLLGIGDIWTKGPTPKAQMQDAPLGFQTLAELREQVDLQPTGATAAALEDIELAASTDDELPRNSVKRALSLRPPKASSQKRPRVGAATGGVATLPRGNVVDTPAHGSEDIELGDLDDELPRRTLTSALADVSGTPSPFDAEEIDLSASDDEDACVDGDLDCDELEFEEDEDEEDGVSKLQCRESEAPCMLMERKDVDPKKLTVKTPDELATSTDNELEPSFFKRALALTFAKASSPKRSRVDGELPRRSPAIAAGSSTPSPLCADEIDLSDSDDDDTCVQGPIPTVVVTPPHGVKPAMAVTPPHGVKPAMAVTPLHGVKPVMAVTSLHGVKPAMAVTALQANAAVERELDFDELELDEDDEDEEAECGETQTQDSAAARGAPAERKNEGNNDAATQMLKTTDAAEDLVEASQPPIPQTVPSAEDLRKAGPSAILPVGSPERCSPEAEPEAERASVDNGLSTRATRFPSLGQPSIASVDEEGQDAAVDNEKAPSVSTDDDSLLAPLRMMEDNGDAKTVTSSNIAVKCASPEGLSVLSDIDAILASAEALSTEGDMAPVIDADDDVYALVAECKEDSAIKDENTNKTSDPQAEELDVDIDRTEQDIMDKHVEARVETQNEVTVDRAGSQSTTGTDKEAKITEKIDVDKDADTSHTEGRDALSACARKVEDADGERIDVEERTDAFKDDKESADDGDTPAQGAECADIDAGAEKKHVVMVVEHASAAGFFADTMDTDMVAGACAKPEKLRRDANTQRRGDDAVKTEDEEEPKSTTDGAMDVEESNMDGTAQEVKEEDTKEAEKVPDAEVNDEAKDKKESLTPVDATMNDSSNRNSAKEESEVSGKQAGVEVGDGVKNDAENETAKVGMKVEGSKVEDSAEEENTSTNKTADVEVVVDGAKENEEKTLDVIAEGDVDVDESSNGDSAENGETKSPENLVSVEIEGASVKDDADEVIPEQEAKVDMGVEGSQDHDSAKEENMPLENMADVEVVVDGAKENEEITLDEIAQGDVDVDESSNGDSAEVNKTKLLENPVGVEIDCACVKDDADEVILDHEAKVDMDVDGSKHHDSAEEENMSLEKATDVEVVVDGAKENEGKRLDEMAKGDVDVDESSNGDSAENSETKLPENLVEVEIDGASVKDDTDKVIPEQEAKVDMDVEGSQDHDSAKEENMPLENMADVEVAVDGSKENEEKTLHETTKGDMDVDESSDGDLAENGETKIPENLGSVEIEGASLKDDADEVIPEQEAKVDMDVEGSKDPDSAEEENMSPEKTADVEVVVNGAKENEEKTLDVIAEGDVDVDESSNGDSAENGETKLPENLGSVEIEGASVKNDADEVIPDQEAKVDMGVEGSQDHDSAKEENMPLENMADVEVVVDGAKENEEITLDEIAQGDVDVDESSNGDTAEVNKTKLLENPVGIEIECAGVKDGTDEVIPNQEAKVDMDVDGSKDHDSAEVENISLEKTTDFEVVVDGAKENEEKTLDETTKGDVDVDESSNGDSAENGEVNLPEDPVDVEIEGVSVKDDTGEVISDEEAKVDMDVEDPKDFAENGKNSAQEKTTDGEVDYDAKEKTPNRTMEADEVIDESEGGESTKEDRPEKKIDGKAMDDDNIDAKEVTEETTPNMTVEVNEVLEECKDMGSAKEDEHRPAKLTEVGGQSNAKEETRENDGSSHTEGGPERTTDATPSKEKTPDRTCAPDNPGDDADREEGTRVVDALAANAENKESGDDVARKETASNEEESSEEELFLEIDT